MAMCWGVWLLIAATQLTYPRSQFASFGNVANSICHLSTLLLLQIVGSKDRNLLIRSPSIKLGRIAGFDDEILPSPPRSAPILLHFEI